MASRRDPRSRSTLCSSMLGSNNSDMRISAYDVMTLLTCWCDQRIGDRTPAGDTLIATASADALRLRTDGPTRYAGWQFINRTRFVRRINALMTLVVATALSPIQLRLFYCIGRRFS